MEETQDSVLEQVLKERVVRGEKEVCCIGVLVRSTNIRTRNPYFFIVMWRSLVIMLSYFGEIVASEQNWNVFGRSKR